MSSRIKNIVLLLFSVCIYSCSKIGYVPLTDVSIDQEVQKKHRETKKFMSKNIRAENTQLPESDPLMTEKQHTSKQSDEDELMTKVKKQKKKKRKLPEGEHLHVIKKKVPKSHRKKFKHPRSGN